MSAQPLSPFKARFLGFDQQGWQNMENFPKIKDTILGIPIVRTVVFWDLYWGLPSFELPYVLSKAQA